MNRPRSLEGQNAVSTRCQNQTGIRRQPTFVDRVHPVVQEGAIPGVVVVVPVDVRGERPVVTRVCATVSYPQPWKMHRTYRYFRT